MQKLLFILFALVVLISLFPAAADAQGLVPCGGEGQAPCSLCHTFVLGSNILNVFLFPIVPIIAAFLIAVAGFFLFTAAGSLQGIQRARQVATATVVGLVIIYGAWLFINLLLSTLGVTIWSGVGSWWEIDCPLPLSISLTGPSSVNTGGAVPLVWTVWGVATSCTGSDDWPAPTSITPPISGSRVISPVTGIGTTKTYKLECTGPGGIVSDTVSVSVVACPGPDATCYQRPIAVDNPGPARPNYQVKITFNTAALVAAGKMRSDCGDLRITDTGGVTIIPHWVEDGCNTSTTNIWIKAPSLAGGTTTTLNAHYGNPGLSSTSSFLGTFPSNHIVSGIETSTGAQNFDWFEVESGATFIITDAIPQNITARKILIAGTVRGLGRGFDGASAPGSGMGPGAGSQKSGAGYGGTGGQGGSGWCCVGVPGTPYGSSSSQAIQMGSGGGDSSHPPGGDGGGAVTFTSQEIVISGNVHMNGLGNFIAGTNASGGGSGGGILIQSSRVSLTGVLQANGGAGANGTVRAGGAGGGGGGRIKIFRDESIDDTSTKTIAGGLGSPGGTTGGPLDPGGNGTNGTIFDLGTYVSLEPTTTVGAEI